MPTPQGVDQTVHFVLPHLLPVQGVVAITKLPNASGISRTDADLDIMLLYADDAPLDLEHLTRQLENVDDNVAPTIGALGSSGPWMNGGAHAHIGGQRVEFTYRNINTIETVFQNATHGLAEHDWLQQPPFGFSSIAYLGEIDMCEELYDPRDRVSDLKHSLRPYPSQLRRNLVNGFLWGAEFTVETCRSAAKRNDIYTSLGAITRTAAMLNFALFSLNERFYISDRGALEVLDQFRLAPNRSHSRVHDALRDPDLSSALAQLGALVSETKAIAASVPGLAF